MQCRTTKHTLNSTSVIELTDRNRCIWIIMNHLDGQRSTMMRLSAALVTAHPKSFLQAVNRGRALKVQIMTAGKINMPKASILVQITMLLTTYYNNALWSHNAKRILIKLNFHKVSFKVSTVLPSMIRNQWTRMVLKSKIAIFKRLMIKQWNVWVCGSVECSAGTSVLPWYKPFR